jgi:hypothetical protein
MKKAGYAKGQPLKAGSQKKTSPKGAPKSSPKKVVKAGSMPKMKVKRK